MCAPRRAPHLRLCVTTECNLKCVFCTPGGENAPKSVAAKTTMHEILTLIDAASELGINSVKLSGGEPLLYKAHDSNDIVNLIKQAYRGGIDEVQMVTNGVMLAKFAPKLAKTNLTRLTVSLETLDPLKFFQLTRKDFLANVRKGIRVAHGHKIPLRINTIVMRSNVNELVSIIKFAKTVDAELKLLDLLSFQIPRNPFFTWEEQYVCNREIRNLLHIVAVDDTTELPPGDFGTPMYRYTLRNGVQVIVKDSTIGTHYGNFCRRCHLYPCQDGLYALRLTSNRSLKACWGSSEYNVHIEREDRYENIKRKIDQVLLNSFDSSVFEREKWYLQHLLPKIRQGRYQRVVTLDRLIPDLRSLQ